MPFSLCYGLLRAHLPACQHIPCPSPIFGAREKSLGKRLSAPEPANTTTPEQIISHRLDWQSCTFDVVQRVWLTDYGVLTDHGVQLRLLCKTIAKQGVVSWQLGTMW